MKARFNSTFIFFLAFCLIAFLHISSSTAQNAPVTTIATVAGALPGQVDVPITVTGFNNIGAISLVFDYQYAGLHFLQGIPNALLGGFAIGDQDLGNGKHRVTMGWFGSGLTLPNGSVIMTVRFTFISGITALEFYDNGPSCEYADASYNVLNDIPQSSYYLNGTVCGAVAGPGTITGDASVCLGTAGVSYSVAPVANATNYAWTVPSGATIVSGNSTNSITVDFSMAAVSGNITATGSNICGNGPSSQLAVVVNPLPVANAGNDVTIPYGTSTTLNAASGGSGSFGYHWSPEAMLVNPSLQNPQTVNLTSTTVFTLTVTNLATLCVNTDEVIVAISGGPLNANPAAIPGVICRGTSAQLFANAGGGSGNYTYTWTCTPPGTPPWTSTLANPVVTPDSSKVYHVSLHDGFSTVQGSTPLTVYQLPTATILGGDTLCGAGNSTILTVNLTGTPPWSFYYSNGITTWFNPAQYTTPFTIVATEPGSYSVLAVSDVHCTGTTYGSAVVAVFPVPPTPAISINGSELFSSGCCGNRWYRDGVIIPGATGQSYTPVATAHYYDIVTVNGCASDTSNTIYFLMAGVGRHTGGNFSVEPNPAADFIRVKPFSPAPSVEEIRIYNITGRPEASFPVDPAAADKEILLDIQQLSPGLYFLAIITKSGQTVVKLMVQ